MLIDVNVLTKLLAHVRLTLDESPSTQTRWESHFRQPYVSTGFK
jgi:hypothetical protein